MLNVLEYSGGGYSVPIGPGYFPFLSFLVSRTPDLSILVPGFTLTWTATYPTQLCQGAETLAHVIDTLGKQPSMVSLAGDSSGGNLALGVFSHLLHPHPELPALKLYGPLGGAVLISPWASFAIDWPSVESNAQKDILTKHISQNWSQVLLGSRPRDRWNEPLSANEEWWIGLEDIVKEILITAGDEEILVDCIRILGKRIQVSQTY